MAPFGASPGYGPLNPLAPSGGASGGGQDDQDFADLLTQLAQRTLAAQQGAQQAGSDYGTAAAAPPPDVYQQHPLAIAASQALARIAQGLGQAQAPAETAATIRAKQGELIAGRLANLASLHQDYQLKAKQASDIGDLESQIKFKALADKVAAKRAELHDTAMEHIQAGHDVAAQKRAETAAGATIQAANIRESGESRRAAAKAAAGTGDIQDIIDNSTQTSFTGRPYIDLTNFTGDKDAKRAAMAAAAKARIPALGKESGLVRNIGIARSNVLDALDFIKAKLPVSPAGRAINYGNIKLSKLLQTNEDRAAYDAYMTNAINVLKTEAGGEGSGLRMTQYEISQVQRALPQITDTYSVAQKKVAIIERLLHNRVEGILGPDRRSLGGPSGAAAVEQWVRGPDGKLMKQPQ